MKRFVLTAALFMALSCTPVSGQERTVDTQNGRINVQTAASGLVHPWGLTFLPDGRMLVTERPGRLRIVGNGGRLSNPLGGVPAVYAEGQGGLLDVAIDPNFASSDLVYLSYSEPGQGGASTAVARGRLNAAGTALENLQVIFRQLPKVSSNGHFGSRLVFARDGTLFATLGDRRQFTPAQDLASHIGKIVRINPDGPCRATTPSSGAPASIRKSGPTASATRRAPRSIHRRAPCGRSSTGRAAATR